MKQLLRSTAHLHNQVMRLLISFIVLYALLTATAFATPSPLILSDHIVTTPVGLSTSYLMEHDGELTLDQAIAAYRQGRYATASRPVLNFGIGAQPAWIHLRVENPTAQSLLRRLSIETAWLDQIDLYILHDWESEASYHAGDNKPFNQRPVASRYFAFDHHFSPGTSELFIRVQTPDPLVLPIYLEPLQEAHTRNLTEDHSYSFLYGFLTALLAYNLMLYAGLRDTRYLLYSLYLGLFMLMNISYTGHGSEWLWPNSTRWAQWSNPILMVLYGMSGLIFALRFLDVRSHFPRLYKGVIGYLAAGALMLLLAFLFNSLRIALLTAFTFVFLFTFLMLALGAVALRSGQTPARYFLLAAIAAMLGAASTALAVWGFIPTNIWTYRAVDIGITLEATLLALALTYQFRLNQMHKLRAEQLAMLDPLTGLNNRRAFYSKSAPIWNITQRHNSDLAIILLDIDRFKQINDTYGHACGDEVLVATAKVLAQTVRNQDLLVRWGGEEFLILLPETNLQEATTLAERLRKAIAGMQLRYADATLNITASFGIARYDSQHQSLDALITAADNYLYQSKEAGRNRVSYTGMNSAGGMQEREG